MTPSEIFVESVVNLLWCQWTNLGVRGMRHWEGDAAVGLEELIILTQYFEEYDPRLRDEVRDWCALNVPLISTTRLKGLQKETGMKWKPPPKNITRTNKSAPPDLLGPNHVSLRIRALFGVGARADIINALLKWPAPTVTASELTFTGYSKRNIGYALDSLRASGILKTAQVGNQLQFSWLKRDEMIELIGALPSWFPRWSSIIQVIVGFLELFKANDKRSNRMARVAIAKTFMELTPLFQQLDLVPPETQRTDWMIEEVGHLESGHSVMICGRADCARILESVIPGRFESGK